MPASWLLMRTALIALIVLVRFGPDIVYAANASLPRPDPAPNDRAEADRKPTCGCGDPPAHALRHGLRHARSQAIGLGQPGAMAERGRKGRGGSPISS
ncbi:hypothetical protein ACRAWG_25935 [Methylobacterium sp. P31]